MSKLKYLGHAVVFSEVPDEISLAINISNCQHRCPDCHSKELWNDTGRLILNDLPNILDEYGDKITCVCLMGGDHNIDELRKLLSFIKTNYRLKTCLYSGYDSLLPFEPIKHLLDYIKIGRYIEGFGGLDSINSNQRFFKNHNGFVENLTHRFWRNN